MTPFIFLIVEEGLVEVVRKAVEKDMLESLEIGGKLIKVNMLEYADDTLFFCKAKVQSVFVILNCFELAFGLKVNFEKNSIGGVGGDLQTVQCCASILNCALMETPFKYLGMLVGGCHKRSKFWKEVVERVRNKLGRWKGKYISMHGRLCLIKSVLPSLPLFYMSLYKMSIVVAKDMMKLQRNFLWGWRSEGRKIAWASWTNVCKPKEEGGLGMLEIKWFNIVLLGKWIWRLGYEKKRLVGRSSGFKMWRMEGP